MSRLVVYNPREKWPRCLVCDHLVDPHRQICEDLHLPCSPDGCVTPESTVDNPVYDCVVQQDPEKERS